MAIAHRDSKRHVLSACVLVCALSVCASRTSAEAPEAEALAPKGDALTTRFEIDDADPESSVPSPEEAIKTPLQMGYWAMLVSERADAAIKRGDHAAAIKYYRAMAKAVPDRAISFTKLCTQYEAVGDMSNAIASCKSALGKGGATLNDHARLVRLLLKKDGTLPPSEVADIDAVLAHMQQELSASAAKGQLASKVLVQQLACELGLRLDDKARLETCTRALETLAPTDPRSFVFSFAHALARKDLPAAEQVIEAARRTGLGATAIDHMRERLQLERDSQPLWTKLLADARIWGSVALIALLAGVALIARRLQRGRRDLARAA